MVTPDGQNAIVDVSNGVYPVNIGGSWQAPSGEINVTYVKPQEGAKEAEQAKEAEREATKTTIKATS